MVLSHRIEAFLADNRIGLLPDTVIKEFGRDDAWNRAHRLLRVGSLDAVILSHKGGLTTGNKDFMDVRLADIPPSGFF
jgi:hypothetical protein